MQGIQKMNKAIRILKDYVHKDINIDQVEILLHLANNEPEPISYSTLSKLMDNSTLSVSMNINILSKYCMKDSTNDKWIDTSLGLVKTFQSPNDSEDYVAFLTDRGTRVVWMLNELIR